MPWTLYGYILRELLKLIVVVVAVLVTLVSFAAAIKPMSDGLLGAGTLLKFVAYSAPTMLGITLPFAGAFAGTLVFIRMASDNEILACSASGMSYAKVLAPVAALGLVLTMGLFYLSNFVVPGFYRAAEETLERDLLSVLVTQLNQNRPFTQIDGYVLYADSARQLPINPGSDLQMRGVRPSKFIQLTGVAVGEMDDLNQVRADSTARVANILLFQDRRESWVTLMLLDAVRYQPTVGELESIERLPIGPITLPSPFSDNTKFLSWPELHELDRHPERFGEVRKAKQELVRAVGVAELRSSIRQGLKRDQGRAGVLLSGSRQDYLVKSPSVRTVGGVLVLASKGDRPITIEYPAGAPERRIEARSGQIKIKPPMQGTGEPIASIELAQVRVYKLPEPEPMTEKIEDTLPPMSWPKPIVDPDIDQQPISALPAYLQTHVGRSRDVDNALATLDKSLQELGRNIFAQLHERAASALTCMMLLVFGSVLAIKLKGQLPLVVFFWSFMLAIVSIIIIHTGQNLAADSISGVRTGLMLLWSGNIGMAVLILIVYRQLARH